MKAINSQPDLFMTDSDFGAVEHFQIDGDQIVRTVVSDLGKHETRLPIGEKGAGISSTTQLSEFFDRAWLRSVADFDKSTEPRGKVVGADLFCGCGGLTLGIQAAAQAIGIEHHVAFASDIEEAASQVFQKNLHPRKLSLEPIEAELDGPLGESLTSAEMELEAQVGPVDFLVGGPPCQGHSDLNNHTRRQDPKNQLYRYMARAAEIFKPRLVVIENVPGARHDRTTAVAETYKCLRRLGYSVDAEVVDVKNFGVPQSRKRYIMVASRSQSVNLKHDLDKYRVQERSVGWAISDLLTISEKTIFDTAASHSDENRRRIDFLFDRNLYNLPNSERPACHRDKKHSYKSVYGRMDWNHPAQTITTGFGSTGQGRFVHPRLRRTITPHEAARLQFFPDFFNFGDCGRRSLQKMIGNAVPPKLGYVLGLAYLPAVVGGSRAGRGR